MRDESKHECPTCGRHDTDPPCNCWYGCKREEAQRNSIQRRAAERQIEQDQTIYCDLQRKTDKLRAALDKALEALYRIREAMGIALLGRPGRSISWDDEIAAIDAVLDEYKENANEKNDS